MTLYKSTIPLLTILICAFIPLTSQAVILYLETASPDIVRGEDFSVDMRIDPEGECVNAIEADLLFSNNTLQAMDFNDANSILSLWIERPKISQIDGKITFAGGIPNGYCGQIPGDPGKSNLVGTIIFRPAPDIIQSNAGKISFGNNSRALLNDGLGTPANLTTKGLDFQINEKQSEMPPFRWQEILEKDNVPPEKFQPEISRNPLAFDNKYFLVFSTTDKQTGIDHYEIYEIPPSKFLLTKKNLNAQSPYLLQDQTLRSTIIVKAVDKAGNERVETSNPRQKALFPYQLIILALIIILLLGWVIMKIFYNGTKHKN